MEDFLNVEHVEELLTSSKDDAQIQLYICMGAAIATCIVLFFLLRYLRKKIGGVGEKHHDKIINKISEVKKKREDKNKEKNNEKIQDKRKEDY